MQAVEERVCDQAVLKLLRAMLRAGVMDGGRVRKPVTGTPQGGVVSPLLANIYLHRLDRAWDVRRHGVALRRRSCATNAAGGGDVEGRADGCGVVLVMEVWPSGTALQGEV